MSSRHSKSKNNDDPKRDKGESPQSISPVTYPPQMLGAYSMPPLQWMHPGYQYPSYYQSWNAGQQFSNTAVPWTQGLPSNKSPISPMNNTTLRSEAFMVNALSRIYGTDDGSIEIERVKVQRKATNFPSEVKLQDYVMDQSLSPDMKIVKPNHEEFYVRKPPPRKNKKRNMKVKNACTVDPAIGINKDSTPPWYPFVPYAPQPYTYPPYPYGYMWPSPSPTAFECQSLSDDSESSSPRHEAHQSLPGSSEPKDSNIRSSPDHARCQSSAAHSHLTESQATDIAPSDSVSMGGYKRKKSSNGIPSESNRTSYATDRTSVGSILSSDGDKTTEWMKDMKKALSAKMETQSDEAPDRTSFMTAHSDIPTPPITTTRLYTPSKLSHIKSNSESNIVLSDTLRNNMSPPLFSNTRVSDTDLLYAFKKLENSADTFKTHADYNKGRMSGTSTLSFHSTRQSADDDELLDTDSTDIALPVNSFLGNNDKCRTKTFRRRNDDVDFKWILQFSDKTKEDDIEDTGDDLKSEWRAEVSLWRAHLVVSLCKGQGLDQNDWNTFQLLVQHPLSMDKKLTLLHPQRICSLNRELGVVFLRNALLHLTTYGEALLKPEDIRPMGWKTVPYDANQLWYTVKGAIEILYVFGYRLIGDGKLKHRTKYAPDLSVLARLTLDILVLTEELRLYLTGAHQYSINISQIFSPLPDDNNKNQEADIHASNSNNVISNFFDDEIDKSIEKLNVDEPNSERDINNYDAQSIATVSSLPDLQSIPTIKNCHQKNSDSSGSITPTTQSELNKSNDLKCTELISSSNDDKVEGPVDHVYEEINEIKAHVRELKEKINKAPNIPPPLPPKQRSLTESFESPYSDAYSQVDWSIDSQCSSIHGGSMVPRRRKRKAPMPPKRAAKCHGGSSESEASSEWFSKQSAIKEGIFKSTNPFYEDLEPMGHVGKNPFYETISVNRTDGKKFPILNNPSREMQEENSKPNPAQILTMTSSSEPIEISENIKVDDRAFADETSTYFNNSLLSDEDNSIILAVRPKRKKNKRLPPLIPPKNKNADYKSSDAASSNAISIDENNDCSQVSQSSFSNEAIENILPQEDNYHHSDNPVIISAMKTQAQLIGPDSESDHLQKKQITSKNEVGEHQCHSHVVVPSNENRSESIESSTKNDVIVQKITISYDICLHKTKVPASSNAEKSASLQNHENHEDRKIMDADECKAELSSDFQINSTDCIKLPESELKSNVDNIFDLDDIAFIDTDEDEPLPSPEALQSTTNTVTTVELDLNSNTETTSFDNIVENMTIPSLTYFEAKQLREIDNENKFSLPEIEKKAKDPFIRNIMNNNSISNSLPQSGCSNDEISVNNSECQKSSPTITSNEQNDNAAKNVHKFDVIQDTSASSSKIYSTDSKIEINSLWPTEPPENIIKDDSSQNVSSIDVHSHVELSDPPLPPEEPPPTFESLIFPTIEYDSTAFLSSIEKEQIISVCSNINNEENHSSSREDRESEGDTALSENKDLSKYSSINQCNDDNDLQFGNLNFSHADSKLIPSNEKKDDLKEDFKINTDPPYPKLVDCDKVNDNSNKKDDLIKTMNYLSNDNEEDRYEIPDVTRAEAIDKERKRMHTMKDESISIGECDPVRPPRNRFKLKPPPLPPKSSYHLPPPALPPKADNMRASTASQSETSKTNVGYHHKGQGVDLHAISPSPLAIPSISPQSYTAPALSFAVSQTQVTQVTYTHNASPEETYSEKRPSSTVPSGQRDYISSNSYKSSSMPSSPKSTKKILQYSTKMRKDRKSWPFQLCTCVSANKGMYDRVPYARK